MNMNELIDMNALVEISKNNTTALQSVVATLGKLSTAVADQNEKIQELEGKLETGLSGISDKFDEYKRNLLLTPQDMERIITAKKKRIIALLGGKESNAYTDSSLRSKCYADIDRHMKEPFGVTSYKFIRSDDTDDVIKRIQDYEFPRDLRESVYYANAQITFGA